MGVYTSYLVKILANMARMLVGKVVFEFQSEFVEDWQKHLIYCNGYKYPVEPVGSLMAGPSKIRLLRSTYNISSHLCYFINY